MKLFQKLSNAGVGFKLTGVAVIAVGVVMGSLAWLIGNSARDAMDEGALERLKIELNMTVDLLSNYGERLDTEAEHLMSVIRTQYSGSFSADLRHPAAVGGRSVPALVNGGRVLNGEHRNLDTLRDTTHAVATLFVHDGQDFVRVATSLRDKEGNRVSGTPLDRNSPAYAALSAGQSFRVRYWQADRTKHRPSRAMCRIVGSHVSRSSTVSAQYTPTPRAYMAVRRSGM